MTLTLKNPKYGVGRPKASTSILTNGGFETNTAGWSAFNGGAIARVLSEHNSGAAALQVICTGNHGAQCGYLAASPSTIYTYSVSVKVPVGVTVTVQWNDFTAGTGYLVTHGTTIAGNGAWQCVSVTATTHASTAKVLLYVLYNGTATFYVDDAQFEAGAVATPYIATDGGTASRRGNLVIGI